MGNPVTLVLEDVYFIPAVQRNLLAPALLRGYRYSVTPEPKVTHRLEHLGSGRTILCRTEDLLGYLDPSIKPASATAMAAARTIFTDKQIATK